MQFRSCVENVDSVAPSSVISTEYRISNSISRSLAHVSRHFALLVRDSVKVALPPSITLESFRDPVLTVIQTREWPLKRVRVVAPVYATKPDKLFMNVVPGTPNFVKATSRKCPPARVAFLLFDTIKLPSSLSSEDFRPFLASSHRSRVPFPRCNHAGQRNPVFPFEKQAAMCAVRGTACR